MSPSSAVYSARRLEPRGVPVPALNNDSVYETLRCYDGLPFLFPEHWRRLRAFCGRLGIPFPWPGRGQQAHLQKILLGAGFSLTSVRIVVTRGVRAIRMAPGRGLRPNLMFYVQPLKPLSGLVPRTSRLAQGSPSAIRELLGPTVYGLAIHVQLACNLRFAEPFTQQRRGTRAALFERFEVSSNTGPGSTPAMQTSEKAMNIAIFEILDRRQLDLRRSEWVRSLG